MVAAGPVPRKPEVAPPAGLPGGGKWAIHNPDRTTGQPPTRTAMAKPRDTRKELKKKPLKSPKEKKAAKLEKRKNREG